MRSHRFFVETPLLAGKKIKIENPDLIHQWRNVLRFQIGQEVVLFDNSGLEFQAVVTDLNGRFASVEIISNRPARFTPSFSVFLFLALPKRDSFEWTLEKATEIGISGFVPVISDRSEKKKINLERSKNIIKEACEQSGRGILPEIFEPQSLDRVVESPAGVSFVLDPLGGPIDFAQYRTGERVNIFVGPEGGWSEREIELFKKKKLPIHTVGGQTLRAETAAVAITSIILLG